MDPDTLRDVASRLTVADSANLALATCDQSVIRERKLKEFQKIFDERMRALWYGRFVALTKIYGTSSFWSRSFPNLWAADSRFCMSLASAFRGWEVETCGGKLYLSTRILDEIVSLTVSFRAPYHSIRTGDDIRFRFDVTHSSHDLDIDTYAPDGEITSALAAAYEALKLKSEQFGEMTNAGISWKKFVTTDEMIRRFEDVLGSAWKRSDDGEWYSRSAGDVRARLEFPFFIEMTHGVHRAHVTMSTYSNYFFYNGPLPSSSVGAQGTMTRSIAKALAPFHTYSHLYPVRRHELFRILIRIDGEDHVFASWNELREVSGISVAKLRSFATPVHRGVFVDFDSNTYRRKKISFAV